jgi:asparagine synthase (glutamine-hydrolysing)
MFEMIDGMFAFAIYDKNEKTIFLAKDRMGKKPLYLYKKDNKLFFASELNSINLLKLEINYEAINSFLRAGFFYEDTAYKDVIDIEEGCYYNIDLKTLNIEKKSYFNLLDFYQKPKISDFNEALIKVDEALHKSVKSRLLSSDLEVGAFLSGGIDSSLITAVASEYTKNLKTFTVKFSGSYDESHLAKLTAQKYNTNHTEIEINVNLKNDIEKILSNYGQPFFDSSAIPSFYVSREAKKYVTVILNGDGADEIFGGYRRYVANDLVKYAKIFGFLNPFIPITHNKKSKLNQIKRLFTMAKKEDLDFYISSTSDIFEDYYKLPNNSKMQNLIKNTPLNGVEKMMYLDSKFILPKNLLPKIDIATMANSLEGRSPFLSKYMLELAPTLSNNLKINRTSTKYILRELSKKYLPSEIINQPKRGFEIPLAKWVDNELKEIINETLKGEFIENFIDRKFINELLENKISISKEKRAKMLWAMFVTQNWFNRNY